MSSAGSPGMSFVLQEACSLSLAIMGITSESAQSRVVNIKHVFYLRFEIGDASTRSGAVNKS